MSAPRIADAATSGERKVAPAPETGRASRGLSVFLSPRAVMIAIPLLVGVVGVFLTLVGQEALRASNVESTDARLAEQAQLVARSIGDALAQADPVLDRVAEIGRAHDPAQPFERVAHNLADLMRGRAGVTFVSLSFPDGTFQGAYVDADGVVRFQDSRVQSNGTTNVRRFSLGGHDGLHLQREEKSSYDPRARPFYQVAERLGRRTWTDPYPFFDTLQTGISRVAPVFRGEGAARALHAVATVDFDVLGLSSQLDRHQLPGTRALLFAKGGAILAYASDAKSVTPFKRAEERLLRHDDLRDPVVSALFTSPATEEAKQAPRTIEVEAKGETYRAAIAPASRDEELPWSMAYIASEELLLSDLARYRTYSALIAALALLVSVGLAYFLALAITRAKTEVARARADAESARNEAKELGSYRLIECLGEGAMGAVWRAEHRLLARQAAIKLIHPSLSKDAAPELRSRFRREAEALAALRSRNTIELFDYGVSEDGTFFYVMELLDGMDLDALVERHGPLPFERVHAMLLQICNSLGEAHERGLVHRDVKPANIYICRAADEVDVIKVLDFGLVLSDRGGLSAGAATLTPDEAEAVRKSIRPHELDAVLNEDAGKLTQAGGLLGTPAFMPPEQVMGQIADGRADLYSVACIAVWLLSGRLVFPYPEMTKLLLAHMREPVPDLRSRLPSAVPDEMVALLTQCLQKLPEQRPTGIRDFAQRLRAITPATPWTDQRAQAWWRDHGPVRVSRLPSLPAVAPYG
jgi:serine/threonine protein kinase